PLRERAAGRRAGGGLRARRRRRPRVLGGLPQLLGDHALQPQPQIRARRVRARRGDPRRVPRGGGRERGPMTGGVRRPAALAAVLLLAALQWACSSPQRVQAPPDRTVVGTQAGSEAPRRSRATPSGPGNPPFYDVLGRRYYVRATSDGYDETGVASWYGRDFHGLRTSSGEIYDMHALTAAHTTLPIPTWVEVTNLENGKRVVVRVNDRGPFVKNRIIDLSYAAAREIDMLRNGTARVRVRAVAGPGAPASPAPVQASAPRPEGGGFS